MSIQNVADILDHLMRDWKNNRHPSSLFGCKCAFLCWSISGLNNTWVGKWEQKIAKLYPELLLDVPAPWKFSEPSVSPGLNTCQPLKQKKKKLKKIKRQAGVFYDSLQEAAALSLSQQSFSLFTFFSSLSLSMSHLEVWKRLLAVICFPHASWEITHFSKSLASRRTLHDDVLMGFIYSKCVCTLDRDG